jgi:tripartite-type tricarboxylate transporter receptor subunit TctC
MRRCFSDIRASAVSRARHKDRRPASFRQRHRQWRTHSGAGASGELGQSVIIEDRPGGAFVIGNDAVAKAQPDGYTLLFASIGAFAIAPHMVAKLPYDIERDFQPIALVTTGHLLLAVAPSLPIHSVAELVEYAKKNPGKLSNASSGSGSPGHVSGELFKFMSGTDIVHVPYKGGTAAVTDLIAGRVDLMFESLTSIAPYARQKAIRALGVSGPKRSPSFPELPTISEAGVPGYEAPIWFGVAAPAGTPRPIVDRLNAAINRAIQSDFFKARYEQIGDEPAGGTPEEFAALIFTAEEGGAQHCQRDYLSLGTAMMWNWLEDKLLSQ